jgi:hypothetical protein
MKKYSLDICSYLWELRTSCPPRVCFIVVRTAQKAVILSTADHYSIGKPSAAQKAFCENC